MPPPPARFGAFPQVALVTILLALCGWSAAAHAMEAVTLQLKWSHAFQFAGYYTAKEKGYYREAGLDVDIREAHPGDDPVRNVLDGKAQYGVGNSSLLLARSSGQPVVVLAALFQHSPVVLLARRRGPVQGIHDMAGKRLMIEPQSDELLAYLKLEGIPLESLTRVEHSFQPQDLIDGKADAISGYVTNEPYFLDRAGFEYHSYTPRSAGIDFYGDNLFTTEQELRQHPARVKAFREASLRGWQYAMAHPEEIVDLIRDKYSDANPREFYLFEASRMAPLFRTDLIEIGYMHLGRWRHIADTYADLGLLPRGFSLDGFIYNAESERDLTWLYLAGGLLLIVSTVALYIHRINRRLTLALVSSKRDHELLRLSEERHRLLADNATDVIWTMNLDGRFTYVSPSVQKLRGYTSEEAMQQSLEQALTPASMPIAQKALEASIAAMTAGKPFIEFQGELEQPCKDGSTVWTEVNTSGMRNADGEFIGILGVTRNIAKRKQMEDQVRLLAFYDPLTRLANRRLLNDRLSRSMAVSKRRGCYGALMFLDLDNFKPLNDTYGHAVGDVLLIEAADRLKKCVRETDTVARFGGDEFVVLISELLVDRAESGVQAGRIAEKIRASLAEQYVLTVKHENAADTVVEHHCTVSIGVALFINHDAAESDILRWADTAMYQAKEAGRNQIRFHDSGA
ncbi:ABC transporter substrate-binding protein [Azoarcus sp. L1K30]|uniref:ABC transporter substrate-binding protein n=1 Tax=Azoarcus sp. L1K30 TaxID=2820277 RepID=UPI001B80EFC5|nr:ABC transporter substrate-binding protein [Azoarcus sp. L1K30]MBR0567128.1 ABC transporter substrate-binding protein [Azoarcus sp. L1K30]